MGFRLTQALVAAAADAGSVSFVATSAHTRTRRTVEGKNMNASRRSMRTMHGIHIRFNKVLPFIRFGEWLKLCQNASTLFSIFLNLFFNRFGYNRRRNAHKCDIGSTVCLVRYFHATVARAIATTVLVISAQQFRHLHWVIVSFLGRLHFYYFNIAWIEEQAVSNRLRLSRCVRVIYSQVLCTRSKMRFSFICRPPTPESFCTR